MTEVDAQPVEGGSRSRAFRIGVVVVALLIVLAILEYVVGAVMTTKNLPVMIAMNIVDAGLIMVYFMHMPRLWRRGEDH